MRVKIDGTEYDINVKEKPSREDAEEAIKELEPLVGNQPAFRLLMDYMKKMALSLVVLGAMSEDQAQKEAPIAFELARELAVKPYPGTFVRKATEGEQNAMVYLARKSVYQQ